MATIKKRKKYDEGGSVEGPKPKKGSFESVMSKSLNSMTPGAPGYKPETAADRAQAAKQAAEMKKKADAGKAYKNGGKVASKAKNISAGPSKKTKKAGKVDPKGAYTKVQTRTLGKAKSGAKMSKCKYGCH
jgi:hypothetical protein